jgi:hypothetical protein
MRHSSEIEWFTMIELDKADGAQNSRKEHYS